MFGSHAVRRGTGAATAVALFPNSLLDLTRFMDTAGDRYDEGVVLFGADRVQHGGVAHRDFYSEDHAPAARFGAVTFLRAKTS